MRLLDRRHGYGLRGSDRGVGTRRDTLGLAAAGMVMLAARADAAEDAIGRVVSSTGVADAVRGLNIVRLAPGDAIYPHDIVRTGSETRLLIVGSDGLRMVIGADTELAVHSYLVRGSSGAIEVVLGLLQGIARLIGGHPAVPRSIAVDTRTAVASVRSTEWLIESTERGTAVLSIEGQVTVVGIAGGSVVLDPGEGTDVPPGGPPKPAATWGQARRLDAVARTTI